MVLENHWVVSYMTSHIYAWMMTGMVLFLLHSIAFHCIAVLLLVLVFVHEHDHGWIESYDCMHASIWMIIYCRFGSILMALLPAFNTYSVIELILFIMIIPTCSIRNNIYRLEKDGEFNVQHFYQDVLLVIPFS